eukprot:2757185-Pyramimonas_sp.AAC.2
MYRYNVEIECKRWKSNTSYSGEAGRREGGGREEGGKEERRERRRNGFRVCWKLTAPGMARLTSVAPRTGPCLAAWRFLSAGPRRFV